MRGAPRAPRDARRRGRGARFALAGRPSRARGGQGGAELLGAVGAVKSVVITPETDEIVVKSARNIPGVVTTTAKVLSVYDIVNAKQLVIDKAALAVIEEVFA